MINMSSIPLAKKRLGRPPASDNQQQRILDHAAKLFAQAGYETTSINDVAAAMGVSKAAIYHYFPTKQDIYDAIILQTLQGLNEAVEQEVAQESEPAEKLRRFMTAHARYFEQHHTGFVVMLVGFGGMANAEFREEAMRLRDEYEGLLRQIITEAVANKSFREVGIGTTSRAVLSLLNWMVRWYKPGTGASAEQLAAEYFELLAGGLYRQP